MFWHVLSDRIKQIKNNSQIQPYLVTANRMLDSMLVLIGVAILTFLIVRINLQIKEINLLHLLTLLSVAAICLFTPKIRDHLFAIGLLGFLIMIFWPIQSLFPSLKISISSSHFLEVTWKLILFPLLWICFLLSFAIRSLLSKSKVLLASVGLLGITLLSLSGAKIIEKSFFTTAPLTSANTTERANTKESSKINPFILKLKKPIFLKAGDPLADLRLNPSIHPNALKREEARLGLDKPAYQQFLLWLDGILVRGDFGLTQQGEPVIEAIKSPLINTLILNLFVLFFSWLIAIVGGVWAASKKDQFIDKLLLTFSSLSTTTPAFLLTIFVLSFAVKLGMSKIGGLTSVGFESMNAWQKFTDFTAHLFLPVAIMTFVSFGGLMRQMRGNLLDIFNEDYIKAARARGIPEKQILWKHALQNAINPLITLLGFEFAALVSGAALTEMILAYPGIGALTLEAAKKLDINLIMFNLLIGTVMLMIGNLTADFLLQKVDPRTRLTTTNQ